MSEHFTLGKKSEHSYPIGPTTYTLYTLYDMQDAATHDERLCYLNHNLGKVPIDVCRRIGLMMKEAGYLGAMRDCSTGIAINVAKLDEAIVCAMYGMLHEAIAKMLV